MILKLVNEEIICHCEGTEPGERSVEARCIVTFRGPDGSIWIGERVIRLRLRRQKEGAK